VKRLGRLCAFLCLALPSLAFAGRGDASLVTDGVHFEVERGHARLALAGGVVELVAGERPVEVRGSAHAELGTRSLVELRWSGRASALVTGKASLGIGKDPEDPHRPGIAFYFLSRAELELRRGRLLVELPQGWSFELGRGAVSLTEHADGRVEVLHRGGADVLLVPPGSKRASDALRLRSGKRLVLPAGR